MNFFSGYDIEHTRKAVVVKTTSLTPAQSPEEVREIILLADSSDMGTDMYIGVLVPGPHPFGNPYHHRLYSIVDEEQLDGGTQIAICVRRCSYTDEVSGESYPGIASNYLCDLNPGDSLTLTGPFGSPFKLPDDPSANLLLIAQGTGIAPFRAMIKSIYNSGFGWEGQVKLFYGARTGLEMVYMNDQRDDFAQYMDRETYQAFQSVSPRPHMDEPAALDVSLIEQKDLLWDLLCNPNTYVLIAGQSLMRPLLEKAFTEIVGCEDKWARFKASLEAGGRWQELLY